MQLKIIIFLVFFFTFTSFSQEEQKQAPGGENTEETAIAIPLGDITKQADADHKILTDILTQLEAPQEISAFEGKLPDMLDSLKTLYNAETYNQLSELNTRLLSNMLQLWSLYNSKLEKWQNTLVVYFQELEKSGHRMDAMKKVWELTKIEAVSNEAPREIRNRVLAILRDIKDVDSKISARARELLLLQNRLSQSMTEINGLISQIKAAENAQRGKLFVKDSPDLWSLMTSEQDSLRIVSQFQKSISELLQANLTFINMNEDRFYFHLFVFVMLIAMMIYLHKQNKKNELFSEDDKALKASAYFIGRPISAAVLIALIVSIWIYPSSTATVSEFIFLILLYPVLRLMPGVYSGQTLKAIYLMAVLIVLDLLQKNAVGFVFFQRLIHVIVSLASIIVVVYLIRPSSPLRQKELRPWPRFMFKSAPFMIILMVISVIANIYGSVSLGNVITWSLLESAYILVTIYIAASVISGLVKVLIRRRRIQAMQFLKTYAQKVERWADFTISTVAFFIWIRFMLKTTGLFSPVMEWYNELLEYQWTVGAITISVDAVVDFVLMLIGTFVLSRLIRVFMDMEIFPRLKLKKGLPAAINMSVRYILVALGMLLAFSALGLDLSKFGLLAGAMGVGLGFGLQKIVANFISSLFIAFGQLIRVGDVLEYGGVMGNVTGVGVNSSTLRTFDGSELIIPNADLISNNVTNWTLSDGIRRMKMPVKVAFNSDPHKVLEVIAKVARDHEDVLSNPECFAVFNGFGDYYLDFTLYYWIPTSLFFKAKTEVALNVYDTLKINGISAPRPQSDLRLTMNEGISTPETIKKPVKRNTAKKK